MGRTLKKLTMPYSYTTSLPAYKENQVTNKKRQCDEVLSIIKMGYNNLLQISQVSGIPQAIVSARMSDLMEEKRAMYSGQTVYQGRLRKKIIVVGEVVQANLFS